MSLGRRLINTGAAACTTDSADVFGDSSGIALYSFDYDASDASGSYDGTPTNVDFGVGGKINTGARFNGSSSKIDLPAILPTNSTADSSVSFWFKYNGGQSGTGTLFSSFGGNTSQPGYHLGLEAAYTYGGVSYPDGSLYLTGYSMGTGAGVNGTTSYADGQWHHVVVTYDFSTGVLSCFVDNASSATLSISYTSRPSTIGPFSQSGNIGYQAYGGPHRYAKCSIDQFRIFSKKLDSTEIDTLYAETACVHTATTTDNNYPTTNAAYLKLDNSALEEVSGNIGTESNVEYRFGRYGQAALFTKSLASFIDTGYTLPQSSTASFSWWMKSSTSSNPLSNDMVLITDRGTSGNYNFSAFIDGSSQNLGLVIANGSGSYFFSTPVALGDLAANWIHLVVTIDGTAVKVYKDASEIQSVTSSATFSTTAGSRTVVIGREGTSTNTNNAYGGFLDQVRIFGSTLSSSQVTELYNEKPETDTSNFKAVLYDGNGGSQYISNVGFQPDFVWIKTRTANAYPNNVLQDSVRGANNYIISDLTNAEATNPTFGSFDANGFTLTTSNVTWNGSGSDYVAWCWKGSNADAVQNNDGTINGANCMVSANPAAGFSIIKYVGNATSGATIGHGLGVKPDLVLFKNLDHSANYHWSVYSNTSGTGATGLLYLNLTDAFTTTSSRFNDTEPTTSVITLGNDGTINDSGDDHIAYCFASVSGYSKIGTYSGSGSSGNAQSVGFAPSFVVVKSTSGSTSNWAVFDNARTGERLNWNTNGAGSSDTRVTLTSTGFEFTGSAFNNSGVDWLYMAFK